MKEKGILLTCDRCGKNIFLKHLCTESSDGGYTNQDKYEDRPEGWCTVDKSMSSAIKSNHLCPDCGKKLKNLLDQFWNAVPEVNCNDD